MNLPRTRIADKLKNGLIASAVVTIITTIANSDQLKNNNVAKVFQSPEFVAALMTLSFGVVGYQTKENAYNEILNISESDSQTIRK